MCAMLPLTMTVHFDIRRAAHTSTGSAAGVKRGQDRGFQVAPCAGPLYPGSAGAGASQECDRPGIAVAACGKQEDIVCDFVGLTT